MSQECTALPAMILPSCSKVCRARTIVIAEDDPPKIEKAIRG